MKLAGPSQTTFYPNVLKKNRRVRLKVLVNRLAVMVALGASERASNVSWGRALPRKNAGTRGSA